MSYWKGRRGRAVTSIDRAQVKKEYHLRQIGELTKELEISRGKVYAQLQAEVRFVCCEPMSLVYTGSLLLYPSLLFC